MNMNTPQIPWNPIHPAMTPLTQKHIEMGLRHLAAFREKLMQPIDLERKPSRTAIADSHIEPFGRDDLSRSEAIEAAAQKRQEDYLGECENV